MCNFPLCSIRVAGVFHGVVESKGNDLVFFFGGKEKCLNQGGFF